MERFSRENIDRILQYKYDSSAKETFIQIAAILIDTYPYLALLFGIFMFAVTLSPIFVVWCIFFAALSAFYFYINVINYDTFKVNKFEIPIKDLQRPFEFIFVSDIHLGTERVATTKRKLNNLVKFVNDSEIDTVVLGGDFVYNNDLDEKMLMELSNIRTKNRIAVYGNHDSNYLKHRQTEELPTKFLDTFKRTGFRILINEAVEIDDIYFGGVPDLYTKNFDLDKTFRAIYHGTKILISHNPDIVDFIEPEDNIALVLSGHNHAGQINLPIIGPVLPMPGKYRWMQRGLYELSKTKLFMSQGFGSGGAKSRIGTSSEVCIIKLVPSKV
jgi:predicted MPP superfamily phosphohydrolase